MIFEVSEGSWGVLGVLLGSVGGQGESGEGWGGPREVPGGSWRGRWNPSFSFF